MDEKQHLSEYLRLAADFMKDPTEERDEAIKAWINRLQIKTYMPIAEKNECMGVVLARVVDREYDALGVALHIEIGTVVFGLLKYAVNLEDDMDILTPTTGLYDIIYSYGLAATILNYCAEDYRVLRDMINNSINVVHAKQFIDTAALLNDTEYDKWIQTMQELKTELTPERLEDLITIGTMSTSEFTDAARELSRSMINQVNNEMVINEQREKDIADQAAKKAENE